MKATLWTSGRWWVGLALLGGLVAGGYGWWTQRQAQAVVQYRSAPIERGRLSATVSASGAVNPVTQVSVGTQVSGQIQDVLADFNSEVRAGQLIARIDPETFEYRVRSAQADVDAAQAAVVTAQAAAAASRAGVSRAQVDLIEAQRDFERKQGLVERQFIAQSEGDKARALVNTATESLKQAQAQAGVAEAQIRTAQANVAQRQAALAQARIDLARTRITSPVTGIVIKRTIERGQTVAASLQSPELFVIAQNLSDMQVDASIDESDVGRIRPGQKASFTVDAFPGQTFEGEVRQVRKAAQTVANVVTYVAVVGFSNAGGRLLPGMTANVRVMTDERENALKVPNAALRLRLPGIEPPAAAASAAASSMPAAASAAASSVPAVASEPAPAVSAAARVAGRQNAPETIANNAAPTGPEAQKPLKIPEGGLAPLLPANGNPLVETRNRLVTELALGTAQAAKVDAIYAEARPRFAALRDLQPGERGKARERISADIRARIAELLSPEQKQRYAALQAQAVTRPVTRGRLYLLGADGRPVAYNVRLGISDGSSTELLVHPNAPEAALLKEGAAVITGLVAPAGGSTPSGPSGPRLPF